MPAEHQRALLLASILGRTLERVDQAVQRFSEQFGALAFVSDPWEFGWTEYYRDELGSSPARRFVALKDLLDPSELPRLKRATCRLEVALAQPDGLRQVNIDPGCLNEQQLIMASTKPRSHRIYLGQGIYADLMLLRGPEGYAPLPWTYPDYADDQLRGLFERLRGLFLTIRRAGAQP